MATKAKQTKETTTNIQEKIPVDNYRNPATSKTKTTPTKNIIWLTTTNCNLF